MNNSQNVNTKTSMKTMQIEEMLETHTVHLKVRTNANGYPYLTFIRLEDREAENIYFSKELLKERTDIREGADVHSHFFLDMQLVEVEVKNPHPAKAWRLARLGSSMEAGKSAFVFGSSSDHVNPETGAIPNGTVLTKPSAPSHANDGYDAPF